MGVAAEQDARVGGEPIALGGGKLHTLSRHGLERGQQAQQGQQ
jgi:hypothetical protein